MKNFFLKIIFTLSNIILSITVGNSQDTIQPNKWYYDYEIDYFPNIKFCKTVNGLGGIQPGSDLVKSLETLLFSCTKHENKLNWFSSHQMSTWGIPPKWYENTPILHISIDNLGKVEFVGIMHVKESEEVNNCLKEAINDCYINPALKMQVPVKCQLFYSIE